MGFIPILWVKTLKPGSLNKFTKVKTSSTEPEPEPRFTESFLGAVSTSPSFNCRAMWKERMVDVLRTWGFENNTWWLHSGSRYRVPIIHQVCARCYEKRINENIRCDYLLLCFHTQLDTCYNGSEEATDPLTSAINIYRIFKG